MHLAKNGLMGVMVDYRLTQTWKHPSHYFIRSVLAWISTRQECYCVCVNRPGLIGYSSGGHLVYLVGTLTDETLTTQSIVNDWPIDDVRWLNMIHPKAVCVGCTPCDLVSLATKKGSLLFSWIHRVIIQWQFVSLSRQTIAFQEGTFRLLWFTGYRIGLCLPIQILPSIHVVLSRTSPASLWDCRTKALLPLFVIFGR